MFGISSSAFASKQTTYASIFKAVGFETELVHRADRCGILALWGLVKVEFVISLAVLVMKLEGKLATPTPRAIVHMSAD